MEECEASADVLLSDTMDQYRTFQMCERLLYSPAKLGNQLLFQIPPHLQAILIERCSIYTYVQDIFRWVSVDSLKGSPYFKCFFPLSYRYYAFDDAFVREILGKKLSKGTKKDLDDISAKTNVTLKSCRRQVQ